MKHWGNRPKKTNLNSKCTSKPSMFIKLMQFYGINMGKTCLNSNHINQSLDLGTPVSIYGYIWLLNSLQESVLLGNGPMSPQIWQEMARCVLFTFISCSQLHQAFLGAPREMASACFSMLQLPHFRILESSNSHRSNSRNRKSTNINNM